LTTIEANIAPEFEPDDSLVDMSNQIRRVIQSSNRIVAFTGAGISAESGIPTYRGAGGVWTKYDPSKYASIEYFNRDPSYYWQFFKDVRHDLIADANPNLAHQALSKLEHDGRLRAIITQNIDGLHQNAGSKRVLELHGNTRRFYCMDCKAKYSLDEAWDMVMNELPPLCKNCHGIIRPDVVLFGEMLPYKTVEEAEFEASNCDLMLVIGSSLVVYPAAYLPETALMNGAKVVIINVDPTPLDAKATMCFHVEAGNLLAQTVWS